MSFKDHQKEKFKDFADILITICLDLILVLIVAFLLTKTVALTESIIGSKISDSNDETLKLIYKGSKIVIILTFIIYIISNIILHVIEKYKKIKNEVN